MIVEVVIVREIERAGPSKIALELEAAGEAFLAAKLERVELDGGIVGKVFDGLSPTELLIEQAALIRAEGAESDDAGLIDVVIRSAGRDVVAVVPDVSDGKYAAGSDLPLDGEVPGIDNRQPDGVVAGKRKNIGRNAVREDGIAVRTFRLSCKDGGGVQRRRTLSQREDREPRVGRVERLIGQNGKVLRDVVAEGNAKDPDIVRAAIPSADDGLRIELVGDSHARGEVLVRRVDVAIQTDAIFTRDHHFTGGEVLEAALVFAVHVLREIDFPTNSVIHGQLRGDAPSVLDVGEEAILAFGRLGGIADVAGEGLDIAKQERGDSEAAAIGARSGDGIEGELSGAVRITGDAEVLREAVIEPELDGVVAENVGHVADILELVFLLVQGAVAGIDAERIAEIHAAGSVDSDRQATRMCRSYRD